MGFLQIGDPAAEAALEAGLKPRTLLKHEYAKFGARTASYLEARNSILQQWAADKTKLLTVEACIGTPPPSGRLLVIPIGIMQRSVLSKWNNVYVLTAQHEAGERIDGM